MTHRYQLAADFAFEFDKYLPARLVIEEQRLAHLFFVQRCEDRLEQRRNRLQATGNGARGDRQPLVTQVLQITVGGLRVVEFAQ